MSFFEEAVLGSYEAEAGDGEAVGPVGDVGEDGGVGVFLLDGGDVLEGVVVEAFGFLGAEGSGVDEHK